MYNDVKYDLVKLRNFDYYNIGTVHQCIGCITTYLRLNKLILHTKRTRDVLSVTY